MCQLFSSPESKAQVGYCHIAPSVFRPPVCKLFTFQVLLHNRWWILMKLGRDEVLMVQYKCSCLGQIRQDPGRGKNRSRGPVLLLTTDWKATATNRMHSNDLKAFGKKCCYSWFQGTLTPPDTWSRPFGTCICSTCWDQSFSEPDYALRISLGTFSVLLLPFRNQIFNALLMSF